MDPNGSFRERVPMANALFANLKNGKFSDASPSAGPDFSTLKAVHRGSAFGDIDNDGRLDLVVTELNGPLRVWRNVSPVLNRWLLVQHHRQEKQSRRDDGQNQSHDGFRQPVDIVNTAVGYGCASDKRVHFGLGKDDLVKELVITWPSGVVQKLENVKADQILKIEEPAQ